MSMRDIFPFFLAESATFSDEPRDILNQFGDMVSALLYSTIFFPEFVEVNGSVFLKDNAPDAEEPLHNDRLTLAEVEASYNSIEVAYLFSNIHVALGLSYETTYDAEAVEIKLAHIIADAWADRLKRLYPSRVFKVSVLTPEESGSVYSVAFYEIR
jgi:hypothetical protein